MRVRYNGNSFDPNRSDNELAFKLFQSVIERYTHTTINEEGYTNQIDIIF